MDELIHTSCKEIRKKNGHFEKVMKIESEGVPGFIQKNGCKKNKR